ncbi:retention module-containing protein [Desulfurivibrio sp. C05AmB]|uniref:retention module-containing protein n=1 Tax=Desulfurivibrio sp. C05AmB TaxID=3374371 RepID=UPI00376F33DA
MASQPVATVIAVFGRAAARNENGELRPLQPGDTLLQGETVITAADGRVELTFMDGSIMEVTADQSILMTAELFETGRPDVAEGALAATTAERILQALEQEEDIDAQLEPPAAGLTGGEEGEGSSFVRLLRVTEEVDPLSYEFADTAGSESPTFAEALIVDEVEEIVVPPTTVNPTVNPIGAEVGEAALTEGAVSVTQPLGVDFGSAGPGSVALAAPGATWNAETGTLTADDDSWQAVVNADGTYTFTLLQAMDHAQPANDESLDVNITVTVTDGEGNVVSAQLTVVVWDDVPSLEIGAVDPGTISLATSDAEIVDSASAGFAASFAAAVTADYGADGPGSLVIDNYTLTVTNANSGLISGGTAIILSVNAAGAVEGRADGELVFTIAVNEAGTVTLTQHGPIDHGAPGSETDQEVGLPAGAISLSATATVTDADGDTASETLSIDLGGRIAFGDDVPTIDVGTVEIGDIILTTSDAEVSGGTSETDDGTSVATAGFGAAFQAAVNADFGADGPGTVTLNGYTLAVTAAEGASGLTSGDTAIILSVNEAGVVEGWAGETLVFTLAVDEAGEVTLTQFAAIDHGAPDTDTDQVIGLPAGTISLSATATVTDADGDTVSQPVSVDLSGAIAFGDDAPNIDVDEVDLEGISLLTSDAEVTGGTSETDEGTSVATASFGAAFLAAVAESHGADGPGEVTVDSYTLSLIGPDNDSGLNSGGDTIYLYLKDGEIVGSTADEADNVDGDNTVFTLSVDSDGEVTMTQFAAIDHGGPNTDTDQVIGLPTGMISLSATATVTDADGDTASDTVSIDLGTVIAFGDDAPSIEVSAGNISGIPLTTFDADTVGGGIGTDSAGFAAAFTYDVDSTSFGADGAAGSINWSYTLSLATGVENGADSGLSSGDASIYLYLINGEIVGSTATDVDDVAGANTVFSLSVDNDPNSDDFGEVTLTQYQAIDHGAPGSDTDDEIGLATGLVVLTGTATITDSDGDTAFASQSLDLGGNISFTDDGPTVFTPKAAYLVNEAGATVTRSLDIDGDIDNNIGADQPGTVRFSADLEGTESGLTAGGQSILYSVSADGQVLTGYTEQAGDIFTITLNHNLDDDDTYTVEMIGVVDGGLTTIEFTVNGAYNFVGGNTDWAGFYNPNPEGDNNDLLLTPFGAGTVNTNANSGGVGGGSSVGEGEAMRVDFVYNLDGKPKSGQTYDPNSTDKDFHSFDGHYNVNGASAKFTGITGGSKESAIRIKAFDDLGDTDNNNIVGDGVRDSITTIGIRYNGESAKVSYSATPTVVNVGGESFTVRFILVVDEAGTGYEAEVSGVVSDTTISAYTADGYSSIEYHWAGGETFKIGDFGTTTIDPAVPVDFTVPVEIVDADGDVATGSISVTMLPAETQDFSGAAAGVEADAADGAPHIIGSDHDDTIIGDGRDNILYGGDGDDVIIGGSGSDTLTGGLGADTFVWQLGDQGTVANPAVDTVTDFNLGEGDVLSLGDLLPGLTEENLSQYISISNDGSHTTINIDTNGNVAGSFNQTIILEGVALSEADLVTHILANLKTDGSEI